MSFQTLAKILRPFGVATSRQFLARHLPRQTAGQRKMVGYSQEKRASTKEELGYLVLGLGILSTSIVWGFKEGAFSVYMTPDELAKLREREAGGEE